MTAMPPRNFNPLHFCAVRYISAEDRQKLIATAAYFRAQRRGFSAGHEAEDWLEAEREVDLRLEYRY
ncbi:MAG TPA: DUF2934 domain-containing protein [Steroidobacteraceae bacterium]|nr:DUF2934 domain-containing protein [Steroidobacteraceae bacterium]